MTAARGNDTVRELFNRVAEDCDTVSPFFAALGERLVAWTGINPGSAVLDLGAGPGTTTRAAARAVGPGGTVVTGDVSQQMLSRLRELRLPGVTAQRLDATALDLPTGRFDVVLAGFLLHVVPDPARALSEVARVLRPGGVLTVSVPGPCDDAGWWAEYLQIYAEFLARVPPEGRTAGLVGRNIPFDTLLERVGLVLADHTTEEVALPISGPEQYWDWFMSQGNRWLYDALDRDSRTEMRGRVINSLVHDHPANGTQLIGGAHFYRLVRLGPVRPATPDSGTGAL
jgi:ubiquinone/menaquinone biosynthesis C-methylase UbiE